MLRPQARDLRIEALEADNYGDAGGGGGDDSDDAYDIESDMEAGGPSSAKTRRTDSRSRAAAATAASTYVSVLVAYFSEMRSWSLSCS
jgi:hypothetical protein